MSPGPLVLPVLADDGGHVLGSDAVRVPAERSAAVGKANRQIAVELYISVKAVEFHLAQILARLGVDTRAQIGDALAAAAGPAHAAPSHPARA